MTKGITGEREFKNLELELFLEKLIKARPIKIVTSFLALSEPGKAAYFYQDLSRGCS